MIEKKGIIYFDSDAPINFDLYALIYKFDPRPCSCTVGGLFICPIRRVTLLPNAFLHSREFIPLLLIGAIGGICIAAVSLNAKIRVDF